MLVLWMLVVIENYNKFVEFKDTMATQMHIKKQGRCLCVMGRRWVHIGQVSHYS